MQQLHRLHKRNDNKTKCPMKDTHREILIVDSYHVFFGSQINTTAV
jgi:hypothetical protein